MDFKSFEEVDNLTLYEYNLLMKAEDLKRKDKLLEREREIYLQAFTSLVAGSTKQVGKKTVYVYQKFEDLYDYEKRRKEIFGEDEKPKNTKLANLITQANSL